MCKFHKYLKRVSLIIDLSLLRFCSYSGFCIETYRRCWVQEANAKEQEHVFIVRHSNFGNPGALKAIYINGSVLMASEDEFFYVDI